LFLRRLFPALYCYYKYCKLCVLYCFVSHELHNKRNHTDLFKAFSHLLNRTPTPMGSLPVLNVRRFRLNLKIGLHACHLPRRTLFFRHMKRHEVSHSCLPLNQMSTADKVSRLILTVRINFKRTSFLLLRARRSFPLLWFGSHFPATGLTIVPLRYGPRMHASMDCMIDYKS
jgi:hypothetical protein